MHKMYLRFLMASVAEQGFPVLLAIRVASFVQCQHFPNFCKYVIY